MKRKTTFLTKFLTLFVIVLAMTLIFGTKMASVFATDDEEEALTSEEILYDNFYYQLVKGKLHITRAVDDVHYREDGTVEKTDRCQIVAVNIPDELPVDGVMYPVEYIDGSTFNQTGAFFNCENLELVSLPSHLKVIDDKAFQNCKSLTSVKLPYNLETLGCNAFGGCTSLTTINIPAGCNTGNNAGEQAYPGPFSGDTALKNVFLEDGTTFIGNALLENSGIETITIPDTVETIGKWAFYGASKLEIVTFSEDSQLKKINWKAFMNSGLKRFDMPDTVNYVDVGAFAGCTSLKAVRLADGFSCHPNQTDRGYDTGIFQGCTSLTDIIFPRNLKTIGRCWFFDSPITGITIPKTVTAIGDSAFRYCRSLKTVKFEDDEYALESIGSFAFYKDNVLESFTFKRPLKTIGNGAFQESTIENARLPDSVTSLGDGAFKDCGNLKSTRIPAKMNYAWKGQYSGNGAFENDANLVSVEFAPGLTKIESGLFWVCSGLSVVDIPEGVTSIGQYSFRNCSNLTEVSLPKSLKSIDYYAFSKCKSLKIMNFRGLRPQVRSNICDSDVTADVYFYIWDELPANWGGNLTFHGDYCTTRFKYYPTKQLYLNQQGIKSDTNLYNRMKNNMVESLSGPIPGIITTTVTDQNGKKSDSYMYTPQGLCKFGGYYITSAYWNGHLSTFYVLNSSWDVVTTFTVGDYKYHNGGIAYDAKGDVLWVCGETGNDIKKYYVYPLSGQKIRTAINSGQASTHIDGFSGDGCRVANSTSCLDYYDGHLWVGTWNGSFGLVMGYTTSGTKLQALGTRMILGLGTYINGFVFDSNGSLYVSHSSGRSQGKFSRITKYRLGTANASAELICYATKIATVDVPRMNEEIMIDGSYMYILYESGATQYSNAFQKTDRFTALPLNMWNGNKGLLSAPKKAAKKSDGENDLVVDEPVTIDFQQKMSGSEEEEDINDTSKTFSFTPDTSGSYQLTVSDITTQDPVFIDAEIVDSEHYWGSTSTAEYNEEATSADDSFVLKDEATLTLNLIGGKTYDVLTTAGELIDSAGYQGSYTITLTKIGEPATVEASVNQAVTETVPVGGSVSFTYTPAVDGDYIVDLSAAGDLGDVIILEDMTTPVEYNGQYCHLDAGKTYYFMTSVSKTEDESAACDVSMTVSKMAAAQTVQDQTTTINGDTIINYTASESDTQIITTSDENALITVYDQDNNIIAQGISEVVVSIEKDSDYRIVCEGVDQKADLTITTYKPDINNFDIKLSKTSATYTGKSIKPKVTIKDGDYQLVENTDYTVAYVNNKKVGKNAKVTITGIGQYSGRVTKTFTIKKAANTLKVKVKTGTVKYSKLKKKNQTVKRSKVLTVSKPQGTVTYTKSSGEKKITINKKTGNVTVKKGLKKGKTYKIKVKVKAAGTSNYNALTVTKTIKIKIK